MVSNSPRCMTFNFKIMTSNRGFPILDEKIKLNQIWFNRKKYFKHGLHWLWVATTSSRLFTPYNHRKDVEIRLCSVLPTLQSQAPRCRLHHRVSFFIFYASWLTVVCNVIFVWRFLIIFSLKKLSHEIEMGCWWYGWIKPYLEMNLWYFYTYCLLLLGF